MQEKITNYTFDDENLVKVNDQLPLWSAPFGLKILENLIFKDEAKVLDICCGTGFLSIELAQRLGKNSEVYAIDISENSLKRLSEKIKIMQLSNIQIVNANAEKMIFRDNYFDTVVSNNGINNLENFEKGISESYRVIKKGGQFIIAQNLPATMFEFYTIFRNILQSKDMNNELKLLDEHIYAKRKSKEQIIEILEKNNFRIISFSEDMFTYKFIDYEAMLNYHEIKHYFSKPWFEIVDEKLQKNIFGEIKSEFNKMSDLKGFIELTIPFICINCTK